MAAGKYEFRPLGIMELIDEAFHVYRSNFVTLFLIAAIPYVLFGTMQGIGMAMVLGPMDPNNVGASTFMAAYLVTIVGGLAMALGQWIATAAICHAVSNVVLDRPITIASSYERVSQRIGPFIGLLLILLCLYIFGFIACIVGIIPVMVLTFLAINAFVIERLSATDAVSRSYTMVKADFWRALGLLILMIIISMVLVGSVSAVGGVVQAMVPGLEQAGTPMFMAFTVLNQVVSSFVSAFVAPLTTAVTTLYYYDLRVRNEAFDLYRLEEAMFGFSESRERAG